MFKRKDNDDNDNNEFKANIDSEQIDTMIGGYVS